MYTMAPIGVLIVDDNPEFRHRLRQLFAEHPEFAVVGEAFSVAGALVQLSLTWPHAVTLDLHLVDGSGFTVLEAIRTWPRRPFVVVLTASQDEEAKARCLALGADVVIDKVGEAPRVATLIANGIGLALEAPEDRTRGPDHNG